MITDLAVMGYAEDSCRMQVRSLHAGVTRETVEERTGFALEFAPALGVTPEPGEEELRILREEVAPTAT